MGVVEDDAFGSTACGRLLNHWGKAAPITAILNTLQYV